MKTYKMAKIESLLQKNILLLNQIEVDDGKEYIEKLYSDVIRELRIIFEL